MHQWKYTADPQSVDFVETLQRDELQSLHLTESNQIVLIDHAGRLLRRYGAHQRAEALKQWHHYR